MTLGSDPDGWSAPGNALACHPVALGGSSAGHACRGCLRTLRVPRVDTHRSGMEYGAHSRYARLLPPRRGLTQWSPPSTSTNFGFTPFPVRVAFSWTGAPTRTACVLRRICLLLSKVDQYRLPMGDAALGPAVPRMPSSEPTQNPTSSEICLSWALLFGLYIPTRASWQA